MKRTHQILCLFCAWTTVSCSSMSNLNDEVHSGMDSWIEKSSGYAGTFERHISQGMGRLQSSSEVYLTALRDDADIVIQGWVDEGRYALALATIDQVSVTHPKYALLQQRRPGIVAQAERYEAGIIQQAQQHTARQEWDQALTLYEQALARLPDSEALHQGALSVHEQQAAHIDRLQLQLLLGDGHKLVDNIRLQQDALAINPRDKLARQRLEKQRRQARRIAQDLYGHALKALDNGRLEEAQDALGLVTQLDSSLDTEQAFDTLREQQAKELLQQGLALTKQGRLQEAHQALSRAQQLRDDPTTRSALATLQRTESSRSRARWDTLRKQFDEALAADELGQARLLLAQMEKTKEASEQLQRLREDLDQRISKAIHYHLSQGIAHYSHDRFEQAILHWQQVLELDPDHEEARQRLDRAQRIVDKLEELRQRQQ